MEDTTYTQHLERLAQRQGRSRLVPFMLIDVAMMLFTLGAYQPQTFWRTFFVALLWPYFLGVKILGAG